mmetsp:Transcript_86465/g.245171  ORF Transcript_86465/g.245171 Transcript_86465/m.245171 type:complete len:548 (+) Transcript_86465:90-1733(+)
MRSGVVVAAGVVGVGLLALPAPLLRLFAGGGEDVPRPRGRHDHAEHQGEPDDQQDPKVLVLDAGPDVLHRGGEGGLPRESHEEAERVKERAEALLDPLLGRVGEEVEDHDPQERDRRERAGHDQPRGHVPPVAHAGIVRHVPEEPLPPVEEAPAHRQGEGVVDDGGDPPPARVDARGDERVRGDRGQHQQHPEHGGAPEEHHQLRRGLVLRLPVDRRHRPGDHRADDHRHDEAQAQAGRVVLVLEDLGVPLLGGRALLVEEPSAGLVREDENEQDHAPCEHDAEEPAHRAVDEEGVQQDVPEDLDRREAADVAAQHPDGVPGLVPVAEEAEQDVPKQVQARRADDAEHEGLRVQRAVVAAVLAEEVDGDVPRRPEHQHPEENGHHLVQDHPGRVPDVLVRRVHEVEQGHDPADRPEQRHAQCNGHPVLLVVVPLVAVALGRPVALAPGVAVVLGCPVLLLCRPAGMAPGVPGETLPASVAPGVPRETLAGLQAVPRSCLCELRGGGPSVILQALAAQQQEGPEPAGRGPHWRWPAAGARPSPRAKMA